MIIWSFYPSCNLSTNNTLDVCKQGSLTELDRPCQLLVQIWMSYQNLLLGPPGLMTLANKKILIYGLLIMYSGKTVW